MNDASMMYAITGWRNVKV